VIIHDGRLRRDTPIRPDGGKAQVKGETGGRGRSSAILPAWLQMSQDWRDPPARVEEGRWIPRWPARSLQRYTSSLGMERFRPLILLAGFPHFWLAGRRSRGPTSGRLIDSQAEAGISVAEPSQRSSGACGRRHSAGYDVLPLLFPGENQSRRGTHPLMAPRPGRRDFVWTACPNILVALEQNRGSRGFN
jgi:hypothetical protein